MGETRQAMIDSAPDGIHPFDVVGVAKAGSASTLESRLRPFESVDFVRSFDDPIVALAMEEKLALLADNHTAILLKTLSLEKVETF